MTSRFEILPFGRGESEAAELPVPVRLTVTASPTRPLEQTIGVGARLKTLGHEVAVHLAARMVRDRAHLEDLLAAMARGGIDDAFVVAGDATPPLGSYGSALELLPLLHEHRLRPRFLGIPGYPEGHPFISSAALADALERKSAQADYVVTQLCFDPNTLLRWVRQIRGTGVELPVLVGIPGLVDRRRLLEVSMRIGVGPSLRYLRKQGLRNLVRIAGSSTERLHAALAAHLGDESLGLAGYHYCTFDRLLETWRWDDAHRIQ